MKRQKHDLDKWWLVWRSGNSIGHINEVKLLKLSYVEPD